MAEPHLSHNEAMIAGGRMAWLAVGHGLAQSRLESGARVAYLLDMSSGTSPEMYALVHIARAAIGAQADEVPNIGKWDGAVFQRLADWHKLLPLVAPFLAQRETDEHARERWRAIARPFAIEAERKLEWQRELCVALENGGIPAMPLRGLLLSRALYGNLYSRALADVDLLVRPEHALGAMEILSARGLRPPQPLTMTQRKACARFRTECAFIDMENRRTVDLHWRAMPSCFELVSDDILWQKSGRTELGGYMFREPRPEHQLLLLCSHGAKHGWDRLVYVVDMAAALQRFPEAAIYDAHRAAEQSPRANLWRFALLLTKLLLGVAPPPELIGDLEEQRWRPMAEKAVAYLLDPQAVGARGGRERRWLRALLSRRRDRWDYWRETALAPSLIEISAVEWPRALWLGYYGMRIMRLAVRLVTRSVRQN